MELKGSYGEWWERLKNSKEWNLLRSSKMWKLILVLAGGLFLLIYSSNWVSPNPESSPVSNDQAGEELAVEEGLSKVEKDLEGRLERALSSVSGAGDVQVTVTMAAGPEHLYATNLSEQTKTTEEVDKSGGNRTITEINEEGNLVLLSAVSGGQEEPVLIKEISPEIAGVLVLSEGARDPALREELVQAVIIVLDIPAHKVTVLPKESR
jgi:stage III sporulation protein AG